MAENNERINATELAGMIGVSVVTLSGWYKWYYDDSYEKPEDTPELPPFERVGNNYNGTRYWKLEDVDKIQEFRKWVGIGRDGKLGEYNSRCWGAKGARALINKGRPDLLEQNKAYFKKALESGEINLEEIYKKEEE